MFGSGKDRREKRVPLSLSYRDKYFKSFYFAESSRVVYSQGETKRYLDISVSQNS